MTQPFKLREIVVLGCLLALLGGVLVQMAALAAVETTTVQGKVLYPDGDPVTSGTILLQLSDAGTTDDAGTSQAVGGRVETSIGSDGSVSFAVVPNDAITPAGTYYKVTVSARRPTRAHWNLKWQIDTSPDPVDIGDITRLEVAPGMTVGNFVKRVATEPSGACTGNDVTTWAEDTDRICECVSLTWTCGEVAGEWTWIGGAAATDVISTRVTGDAQDRLAVDADGTLGWGPGDTAADITLGRGSLDHLAVNSGTLIVDDPSLTGHGSIEGENEKVGLTMSDSDPIASFNDLTGPLIIAELKTFDPLGGDLANRGMVVSSYLGSLSGGPTFLAQGFGPGGFTFRIHKEKSAPATDAVPLKFLMSTSTNNVQTWFAQAWVNVYNPNIETKDRVGFGADKTSNVPIPVAMESPLSIGEHKFYISDTTNDFEKYWMEYDAVDEDWEVHDAGGCFAELPLTNAGNDVGQKGEWQTTCD